MNKELDFRCSEILRLSECLRHISKYHGYDDDESTLSDERQEMKRLIECLFCECSEVRKILESLERL